jgi:hypothetical protein
MPEVPEGYNIYFKDVILRNSGRFQRIYFFVPEGQIPKSGEKLAERMIPRGWVVVKNPRSGLPFLKRELKE